MENLNSVAYISKINSIEKIEGADKVVKATCGGWSCVIPINKFNINDLVLCITQDAVISKELAEKFGVLNYLRHKKSTNQYLVHTVKLRGVYSECILIPSFDIPLKLSESKSNLYEGRDLMGRLEIIKYELPLIQILQPKLKKVYFKWNEIHKFKMWKSYSNYLINVSKSKFKKYQKSNSNFKEYYKFPNQKNTPNMFNEQDIVVITRKIHGANWRASISKKNRLTFKDKIDKFLGKKLVDYEFCYGSHRVQKDSKSKGYYSTDIWGEMITKYNIESKMWDLASAFTKEELGSGITLYGEVYGEGVQGKEYNYGLKDRQLAIFDMELDGKYLEDEEFNVFNELFLNIDTVPYLYYGKWSKEIQDKYVGGFIKDTKSPEEGIVVKCISGDRKKISKVINPDYHTFGEKNNIEDLNGH